MVDNYSGGGGGTNASLSQKSGALTHFITEHISYFYRPSHHQRSGVYKSFKNAMNQTTRVLFIVTRLLLFQTSLGNC